MSAVKNKIIYRRENLIVIQKNVKMHLSRKQHQPRYRGIMKINSLQSMLTRMEQSIGQLKKEKDASSVEVTKLKQDLTAAIQKIKVGIKNQLKFCKKRIKFRLFLVEIDFDKFIVQS